MTGPGHSRRLIVRSSRFPLLVSDSHKVEWQKQGISVPTSSTVLRQQAENPTEQFFGSEIVTEPLLICPDETGRYGSNGHANGNNYMGTQFSKNLAVTSQFWAQKR